MTKTIVMIAGLAGALAFGTACFSLRPDPSPPAGETGSKACDGLAGQAKIECEERQGN